MSAKLELSLRGLLKHCTETAEEDETDWRLKKYIQSVDEIYSQLSLFDDVEYKSLLKYKSQIDELKRLTNYKEPPKKATSNAGDVLREIKTIKTARLVQETRKELLGEGMRQRTTKPSEENLEQAVKHYENMQEKIAEDMLVFTQSLKEQTEAANRIIKQDTELMGKSTTQTDKNLHLLKSESQKLQEHSKRAWKCWMWIMIGLVVAIFMFMVLFMKVTKKRTT